MSCRFIATFALAALAYGPAAAIEAVTGIPVVIHVAPGAEHRIVGSVPADERVTVHGCVEARQWCLVRFEGRHGWTAAGGLEFKGFSRPPAPAPVPAAAPAQVIIVPVPIEQHGRTFRPVSADDVIISIGEQFGLAALAGSRFGKHGFHSRRDFHFGRRHFDKTGLHFHDHGKGDGDGRRFKKRHHHAKFTKHGKFHGHSGKFQSMGFRVKGGWRP